MYASLQPVSLHVSCCSYWLLGFAVTRGFPIPLTDASKQNLRLAVFNDTLFLARMEIVDYSLLVGFDESKQQMAVGIIGITQFLLFQMPDWVSFNLLSLLLFSSPTTHTDYIRQYTWDKQLETGVKSLGMIAGKAQPTVVSPKVYKSRFRLAMDRYFMVLFA